MLIDCIKMLIYCFQQESLVTIVVFVHQLVQAFQETEAALVIQVSLQVREDVGVCNRPVRLSTHGFLLAPH